jgi:transposase
MSYNFREYDQNQLLLMPPSIQEWVREDSLPRFLSEVVDGMDANGRLDAFYAPYREDGRGAAAFHPVMMLKVLLYAYTNGVTSSRRIEAMLEVDIAFRYLAANNHPGFRTINDFRTLHLEALLALFVDVLELCRDVGMVKLGRVALDGHRVSGDASLSENRTRERLEQQVQQLLEEAALIDAQEDGLYGPDARGSELPSGLKKPRKRAEHLQHAIEELKKREAERRKEQEERIVLREKEEQEAGRKKPGRKPKPAAEVKLPEDVRVNRTDPQSRVMKARRGWVQGYNGQAMVDCDSQVIVAQELTNEGADVGLLASMLERCEAQAGARPEQLLADAGYWSEANGALDGQGGTDLLIATVHWAREKPEEHPQRDRMEAKLEGEEAEAAYAQRGSTVEPVFGQMVTRGLERFRLRGLKKTGLEWSLWCTTHNLLKLWRHAKRAGGRIAPCTAALAA